MDAYEATQVVFARVQSHDPENVSRIIGYLLLQDRSEQSMARLALGPDSLLHSAIAKARCDLGLAPDFPHLIHEHAHAHRQMMSCRPSPLFIPDASAMPDQFHPDQDHPFAAGVFPNGAGKRNLQDLAMALACKPCLYYSRGYCKHGSSCRFLHGSSPVSVASACSHCTPLDDLHFSSPSSSGNSMSSPSSASSLERLEMELQELLRARRTPVSIASLPQLYFERFGKALQAQGYLTESQRHGKAGCSLTKLLARLKGSVALIDRPHGQHAVVLAEDAQRFVGYKADRDDLKDVNPSSRQIYLTFPAESTFTEEDVSAHFRAYGPVQDVRIPYQQKRMFGFVTFLYMETVKTILSEGNPHYICGARVLVKPYREKAKIGERKQAEKLMDVTSRIGVPPLFRSSLSGKSFIMPDAGASFYDAFARSFEDEQRMLEMERRRMLDFQRLESLRVRAAAEAEAKLMMEEQERISSPEVPRTPQISEQQHQLHSSTDLNDSTLTTEDMQQFQLSNPFGFVMDVLESEAEADSTMKQSSEPSKNDADNLPESPFASPMRSSSSCCNESLISAPVEDHQGSTALTLQDQMMGLNLNEVLAGMASESLSLSEIICCICLEHCVEPSKLDCDHTFCVQCILKVIRGSKDECPICRQHIGSQVYKTLQNRDLQSWLSPTLSLNRVAQHIW